MSRGLPALPPRVVIREVGPRDGLQGEAPLAVADRVALIEALVEAGAVEVEAVAFVSPRLVPAMAGAAEVLAALGHRPGLRYWALVPNLRGAELALEAGAGGLTVTASASEAYSVRNVGRSVDEAVAEAGLVAARSDAQVPVDAVLSCSFGSPFGEPITPESVAALARRLLDLGVDRLTLADTTGLATPRRLTAVLDAVSGLDWGGAGGDGGGGGGLVGLHLHDSRGTALVNAFVALQCGVTHFDCALGGLGGSPFAPSSGGNLATEDLVHLLDDGGVTSGFDLGSLLAASRMLAGLVGHGVASPLSDLGPAGGAVHAVV